MVHPDLSPVRSSADAEPCRPWPGLTGRPRLTHPCLPHATRPGYRRRVPAFAPPTIATSVLTISLSSLAWAESSSLAEADSSALAALDWVTLSICATAVLICSMPWACSLLAAAISPTSCVDLAGRPSTICVEDRRPLRC